MIDLLFHITLNNASISLVLAIAALITGITLKRPAITHLLWLLVFVKLLTPPVVMIPAIPNLWSGDSDTSPQAIMDINEQQAIEDTQRTGIAGDSLFSKRVSNVLTNGKQLLFLTWLLGSMIVFTWSLLQVYRFHRLLKNESDTASPEIMSSILKIGNSLGLKNIPAIRTTTANVSPMVWWTGRKVWVVIPVNLIRQMDAQGLQWILSHELAHVRRRDYIVRWIEWLVCVFFWWNPVTWWARYNLRANEELCCDDLVLSILKPKPYVYGDSLLKAVEILVFPACCQPIMASGINGGKLLKRRVKMIVSNNKNISKLRWLKSGIIAVSLIVLPLGLTVAKGSQENEPQKVKLDPVPVKVIKKMEHDLQETKAALRQVHEELETGKISKEEADKKVAELEWALKVKEEKILKTEMDYAVHQVKEAVKAGKISKEEAKLKLAELEKAFAQKHKPVRTSFSVVPGSSTRRANVPFPGTDYAAVLKAAMDDGKLTVEYVEDKLFKYEEDQYNRIKLELEEAVAEEKITRKEADAKIAKYGKLLENNRAKRQLYWEKGK